MPKASVVPTARPPKASAVPTRARLPVRQQAPRPRPATRRRPKASVAKASAVASTDVRASVVNPRLPLRAAAAGLGLRRALLQELRDAPAGGFGFLECPPENWVHVCGPAGDPLAELGRRPGSRRPARIAGNRN